MDRITQIEARLAAIEAALPSTKKPIAPRREDGGLKITTFLPTANPKHMPSDDESRALLRIVTARYPQLKFQNADDELESFRAAFRFVVTLTKTAQPVKKFAASWWVDQAQTWCRAAGVQGVVRGLLPAIIATGDVQFTLDDFSAFWVDPFRSSGRVVDAQKWRQLLNGGDLLAPTKLNVFIDHSIGLQRVQAAW